MSWEDDIPTSPDLASFPCPWCRDDTGLPSGFVMDLVQDGTKHSAQRHPCRECKGNLVVDRASYAKWKALQG